jgi:hypothetical protein
LVVLESGSGNGDGRCRSELPLPRKSTSARRTIVLDIEGRWRWHGESLRAADAVVVSKTRPQAYAMRGQGAEIGT